MLYGPPPRNNEFIHQGERLAKPNTITVDENEDGGFGEALDLYCSAVQRSTLAMEFELMVEAANSLGVGVERKPSASTPSGEPQGS